MFNNFSPRALLKNAFAFCEEVFGTDQEMVLFITELTANKFSSLFISHFLLSTFHFPFSTFHFPFSIWARKGFDGDFEV